MHRKPRESVVSTLMSVSKSILVHVTGLGLGPPGGGGPPVISGEESVWFVLEAGWGVCPLLRMR